MRSAVAIVALWASACGLTMTKGPDPRQLVLETESGDQDVGAALLIGGVVTVVASYASGAVGYYRVKRCKKAIGEFDQRNMVQPTHPTAPPPPPIQNYPQPQ